MIREQWLSERRRGIGASDIAAVLGISPFKTPLELFLDKRGELPQQEDKAVFRRGRLLEPVVLQFYEDETGHDVTRQQEHIVADGWKMATLDGFDAVAHAPVEAKTVNAFHARAFGEHGSDDVPLHYAAQVHWQIMLTGTGVGYLAALIGSDDFRIFELKRDRELEDMLIARATEFWQRVQSGRPPEPQTETDIRLLYPRDSGSQITTTPDISDKVLMLAGVKEQIKELETREGELSSAIKTYIGEHSTLIDKAGKPLATWKSAKGTEKTNWQSAFEELLTELNEYGNPELIASAIRYQQAFTVTTPGSRRFLLKGV